MKVKCFLCDREYEEGESFEMHYVDGDCFIDTDEKINKMMFMSKLLFKIHEKIRITEQIVTQSNFKMGDQYLHQYSIHQVIEELKSLLEDDKE